MPDHDPMNDPFDHDYGPDNLEGDGRESSGDDPQEEALRAIRVWISRIPGADAPPLSGIVTRARGYKRRRTASFVGAATAAAAVAAGLPVYLSQQRVPVNADLAGFEVASHETAAVSFGHRRHSLREALRVGHRPGQGRGPRLRTGRSVLRRCPSGPFMDRFGPYSCRGSVEGRGHRDQAVGHPPLRRAEHRVPGPAGGRRPSAEQQDAHLLRACRRPGAFLAARPP